MLYADCEWLSGCLRIYDEKDPVRYIWSCTVQKVDDVLWLKGVVNMPPQYFAGLRESIRRYCLEHDIKKVCWERRQNGRIRVLEFTVEPEFSLSLPAKEKEFLSSD